MTTEPPVRPADPGLPPSGTLVRSRPRLPRLTPGHGATLPRSKSQDIPRVISAQDVHEQTERDLQGAVDSLGSTDFKRKYSLKKRSLGSPAATPGGKSPVPASGPFSAPKPGLVVRRTASFKLFDRPTELAVRQRPESGPSSRSGTPGSPGTEFLNEVSLKLSASQSDLEPQSRGGQADTTEPAIPFSTEESESVFVTLAPSSHTNGNKTVVKTAEPTDLPSVSVTEESKPVIELTFGLPCQKADDTTTTFHAPRGSDGEPPVVTRIFMPGPIQLHSVSTKRREQAPDHECEHASREDDTYELEHVCSKHHLPGQHVVGHICVKDILQKFGSTAGRRVHGLGVRAEAKTPGGRFLTHPPLRERPVWTRDAVSVDSNGLGALRDSEDTVPEPGELVDSGQSAVSLADSHLTTSDTTETFADVVAHVTSQPYDYEKLERRNEKVPKPKSISDPSGQKGKLTDLVDLPTIISTHSSPEVSERNSEASQPSTPLVKEFHMTVTGEPPDAHEVAHHSFFRQASLEEDETWQTPPVSRESSVERDASPKSPTRVKRRSDKKRRSPLVVSSSADLTSEHSGSAGDMLQEVSNSLDLPPQKRVSISRSHSSASVMMHKSENIRQGRSGSEAPESSEGPELSPAVSVPDVNVPGPKRKPRKIVTLDTKTSFSGSDDFLDKAPQGKDKRDLIVTELYSTERQYVESLQMLVEKYMIPMKTQSMLDSSLVDDIFYKINEIYMHHATFLSFMGVVTRSWDSSRTIGGIIHQTFSKQSVIESYIGYINNFSRAEKVLDALSNKTSFQRFVEQCEKESKTKLPLKAQIVKPAQRIPRYELLVKRLIDHTPQEHADYKLLQEAERAVHALALRINSVKEGKQGEPLQETLKKLELMLITDLMAADRFYIRHDMITVMGRKDQCCLWLFSDLAVFTTVKRKSGTVNRKTTLLLQSPTGHDFAENVKHKTWLRVALEDMEIATGNGSVKRDTVHDKEALEQDQALLQQMSDFTAQLQTVEHQILEECLNDLLTQVNRQLADYQLKHPPLEANRTDLLITAPTGLTNLTVVFSSPDKRSLWEAQMTEAKQKLSYTTEECQPEFQQALPITKTRAGMQFSCASPIEYVNPHEYREVWVCNSDGYVGHVCLLSLQPEPIVTLNTAIPGCNSRILCICAVPTFQPFSRTGSTRKKSAPKMQREIPNIQVKVTSSSTSSHDDDEDGYVSDSSMSSSDDDMVPLRLPTALGPGSRSPSPSPSQMSSAPDNPVQDPEKSTMWLGTEDGCIHIFHSTDNVKTTKNRIKVQHGSGVLCVVYVDQKVFVSLANGSLAVYFRTPEGTWDIDNPRKLSLASATSPVNKMLSVMGKLWCACQNEILVLNPVTLNVECSFTVSPEAKKSVCCMATCGLCVWLATQGSSKVMLLHAKTYQCVLEVSVAQAVTQKLQAADDIIKQHKTACLRITALLTCKDLLWVGTSAGVILTLPVPKLQPVPDKAAIAVPAVTGLMQGHTGHVRFLTTVDMSGPPSAPSLPTHSSLAKRRASVTAHSASMATKMLIISGGDGYEDFRANPNDEEAGKDDSTNHLLLWQV